MQMDRFSDRNNKEVIWYNKVAKLLKKYLDKSTDFQGVEDLAESKEIHVAAETLKKRFYSSVNTSINQLRPPGLYEFRNLCNLLRIPEGEIIDALDIDHPYSGRMLTNSDGTLTYRIKMPPPNNEDYRNEVEQAIRAFQYAIGLQSQTPADKFMRVSGLKPVFKQKVVEIIDIHRLIDFEQEIACKFNLERNRVIVADTRAIEPRSIVRVESVATLAAKWFNDTAGRAYNSIGIDDGYTLSRFTDKIRARRDYFVRANIIALSINQSHNSVRFLSANHLAANIAEKFQNARPSYFPELHEVFQDQHWRHIVTIGREMQLAFITVNGLQPNNQLETADGAVVADISELVNDSDRDKYSGSILGIPFDYVGNVLPIRNANNGITDKQSCEDRLRNLRAAAARGAVWLVASNNYKSYPTYVSLVLKWVNGIIIDHTIAEYLLGIPDEAIDEFRRRVDNT